MPKGSAPRDGYRQIRRQGYSEEEAKWIANRQTAIAARRSAGKAAAKLAEGTNKKALDFYKKRGR